MADFGVSEAIAIAGIIAAAAGTAVTVTSSIQQQNAASDAAKAEQAARDVEAKSARDAAAYEEQQFRRRAAFQISKNNALAAASGLDITSGSPLLAELDNIQQTELEALNIRRTGAVTASSREFEGQMASLRGSFARSQIGPIAVGGAFKAGSSILGSWASYNKISNPRSVYSGAFQTA